jgi:hypothetical protein
VSSEPGAGHPLVVYLLVGVQLLLMFAVMLLGCAALTFATDYCMEIS